MWVVLVCVASVFGSRELLASCLAVESPLPLAACEMCGCVCCACCLGSALLLNSRWLLPGRGCEASFWTAPGRELFASYLLLGAFAWGGLGSLNSCRRDRFLRWPEGSRLGPGPPLAAACGLIVTTTTTYVPRPEASGGGVPPPHGMINFFQVISYQAQRLTTTVLNLSWLLNEARTRVIALRCRSGNDASTLG